MKRTFISIVNSRPLLWLLLSIPAFPYLSDLIWPSRYYPEMMERSGILSVQLLVFTLMITPLSMIMKLWDPARVVARWLLSNRRYFGMAGFAYAAIHTVLYIRYVMDIELIWLEAWQWSFGTGWIAMIILFLVALTSNNPMVRKLGKNWKPIQQISYIAIIAAFIHWILLDFFIDQAMQWIVPLAIAKLFHFGFRYFQRNQPQLFASFPWGSKIKSIK